MFDKSRSRQSDQSATHSTNSQSGGAKKESLEAPSTGPLDLLNSLTSYRSRLHAESYARGENAISTSARDEVQTREVQRSQRVFDVGMFSGLALTQLTLATAFYLDLLSTPMTSALVVPVGFVGSLGAGTLCGMAAVRLGRARLSRRPE